MLTVRLASPADADALIRLNTAFNGVEDVSPDAVRQSLQDSPEIVVIADLDGTAAGFCCAQVHHSFCYPAPVAEVTEMYVDEKYRRMGCASRMLEFLEEQLIRAYGADEIHLLTGRYNIAAQSAYINAGFRIKNEVYMTKDLARKR